MSEVRLILPYPPTVNHMYRPNGRGGKVRTDAYEAFLTESGWRANMVMVMEERLTGRLAMEIILFRPQKKGDADNRIKAVSDSLNKIVYEDDAQIEELHVYRKEDAKTPRCEVRVWQL